MLSLEMQKLVLESTFACGVLGRADGQHILIPLEDFEAHEDAMESARERGMYFCGCVALVDGQARVKCADSDTVPTMIAATGTFARYVAERLKPKKADESVSWLERLFQLPDTRTNI